MLQIGVLLLGTTIYADNLFKSYDEDKLFIKDGLTGDISLDLKPRNENYKLVPKLDFSNEDTGWYQRNSLVPRLEDIADFRPLDRRRIDLKTTNNSGETLLHIAASEGLTEVARYLLDRGFSPDVRTEDAYPNSGIQYRDTLQTPMHYAATGGHVEILALLAGHGADICAQTESGDSPLHKAALHGQIAAARWLLDHGAQVDSKNVFGASPLTMALVNHRQEMAELLVDRGALGVRNDLEVTGITEFLLLLECSVLLILKLRMS